jgi:hypothetical protein
MGGCVCCVLLPHPAHRPNPLCHSGACQEVNAAHYITGVGRMFVEWCETLWARMGGLGHSTQYRTPLGRCASHEHGAQVHNLQQAKNLPKDLCSMAAAARAQHVIGVAGAAEDLMLLLLLGVGEPAVRKPDSLPALPCQF